MPSMKVLDAEVVLASVDRSLYGPPSAPRAAVLS